MSAVEAGEGTSVGTGLRHYLALVRRRWLIVALVTAVAIAADAAWVYTSPVVHRAELKIVIGQGNSLFQPQFGSQAQPFTATMSDLLQSNVVAERVISSLGLATTPEQLLDRISVSMNPQTAVLRVQVDEQDTAEARRIAHQVGVVFSELVKERFGNAGSSGGTPTSPLTATVFDPAHVLPGQVSPKPVRDLVVAGVLGLVLGLLGAFLREHFDRGLRTREDVEQSFGLPVIGQVPFARKREDADVSWQPFGEVAEAYRVLRTNLEYVGVERPLRTILITSASPEQGKTTVAANLGVALARSGASTIVVEADLRRPRLNDAFGIPLHGQGLTSALVGMADLDDVVREVEPPEGEAAGGGRLSFVPSGALPPNPSELLASEPMAALLDRLAAHYEYVLIDSPPVLPVSDALALARQVDGVVLVVRRNHTSTDEARELRSLVDRLGVHLVGVVLTDVERTAGYGGYGSAVEQGPTGERGPASTAGAPEASVASDEFV